MRFRLLICDLDNTLYDWVAYFVPTFYAMVDKAVDLLGCDREDLLDDFRKVHQLHHDSEHPFALLETKTVRDAFPEKNFSQIAEALDPAFHAFNSSRKQNLKLHKDVRSTLEYLSHKGVRLIAHTDSKLNSVVDRLTRLEIGHFFERVYCRERPDFQHPNPSAAGVWLQKFPLEKVTELTKHQMKPNPNVLREICEIEGMPVSQTAYVGDSVARDILMAKRAGVFGIWTKYGAILHSSDYEKLVRISHWTAEDVEKERQLKEEAESVQPDFIATDSFRQVLIPMFPEEEFRFPHLHQADQDHL